MKKGIMAWATTALVLLAAAAWAADDTDTAASGQEAAVQEAAASAADASGHVQLDPARVDAFLDGLLPYMLEEGDMAGAVVTVVQDGRVVTERGYGFADMDKREPVDPARTLFRPGSVSKLFVWTAVMQLVEEGKLDLDEDINTYLDFTVPVRGEPITLRNVMTHTSGLEERVRDLILLGPDHPATRISYLTDRVPEQIIPPGTRPAYSNYATGVAAHIVERISGLDFETYVQRRIFDPLGMSQASFQQHLTGSLAADVASGYRLATGPSYPAENVVSPGVGGLYVSGAAMSRFMLAYLGGGELDGQRILSEETVRAMQTPQPGLLEGLESMSLGWMNSETSGYHVLSHGGTTLFFYSWLYLVPEQGLGVFVSTNTAGRKGAGSALRAQVFERLVETFLPVRTVPAEPPLAEEEARRQGSALAAIDWQSTRRSESSYLPLTGLLNPVRVRVDADGLLTVSGVNNLAGAPVRWRATGPGRWQAVDSHHRMAWQEVQGRPVYFSHDMALGISGYDPIPAWRSPRWLKPAMLLALALLAITAVLRVGGLFTRRRYRQTWPREGRAMRWLQNVAIAAVLLCTVAWVAYLSAMDAPGAILDPSDGAMWGMRLVSWLALLAPVGLLAAALRQPAVWPRASRLWSWVLVAAAVVTAWVVAAHGLATFSLHY